MILSQVSVGLHAQSAPVFVAEPSRDSENINAALDTDRRKEVPQIMMRDPLHAELLRRVRHAVLAFEHAHHCCRGRLARTLRTELG